MFNTTEFLERNTALLTEFREQMYTEFKELFSTFWEENPEVQAVIWTQYASYFNDGDACVFSVNEPCFTNATGEQLDYVSPWGVYEGDDESIWVYDGYSGLPEHLDPEPLDQLSRLLYSSVMEEVMEQVFGSDNKVTATREGFFSEDYGGNHD